MNYRQRRLSLISDIIRNNDVSSQGQLVQILKQKGYNVNQATLSRNLRDINAVRIAIPTGGYRYVIRTSGDISADSWAPGGPECGIIADKTHADMQVKPDDILPEPLTLSYQTICSALWPDMTHIIPDQTMDICRKDFF